MRPETPNHALQRTAPAVTLAAPPPAPAQPSRQPPPSLSLGSFAKKMNPHEQLIDQAFKHYVESRDFNGHSLGDPCSAFDLTPEKVRDWLGILVSADKVVLRFGEHGNPFIKAFPDPPIETQLKILNEADLSLIVVYPSNSVLAERVDKAAYHARPFTLRLALGEAQLDYHSFDLSVLEFYRNDPRYFYRADDVHGTVYLHDEHARRQEVDKKDNVYLQTFGFSYDNDMNRSVATYTRYLHDLSPEHQQIWDAKRLAKRGRIHPDYYGSTIRAMFPDHIPILTAFTFELHYINEMAALMERPPLYRKTFKDEARPSNFTFLIRPTAKEFYDFVLLLDQAMSDNINKKFFGSDVPLEEEIERNDGKIEVRQRGTIALLDDWIRLKFHPEDASPLDAMIAAFRKVRKLRQKPAHSTIDNVFDQSYFKQQRELILEAYQAIRLIRLVLANHPNCQDYEVDEMIYDGRIRDF